MCRFSNTDSEVRFSAQDWTSRNPEEWTIYSQRCWLKPKVVTLIFPLPVISLTVRKYSSFSGSIGGILWKGSLQRKKKTNLTCNSWISHIPMYRTISGFCWTLVDWWMLAQWSWSYIKSGPGRASPWSWWWFTFKIQTVNVWTCRFLSPSERGPEEVHVPVNLGAVPEALNVGGVHSYGVDQGANSDAITDWRRKHCQLGALTSSSITILKTRTMESLKFCWRSEFIYWGFNTGCITVDTDWHFSEVSRTPSVPYQSQTQTLLVLFCSRPDVGQSWSITSELGHCWCLMSAYL